MPYEISFINISKHIIPKLTTELIEYFSIDGNSQYRADLLQLKYYISPSNFNNMNFDLNNLKKILNLVERVNLTWIIY